MKIIALKTKNNSLPGLFFVGRVVFLLLPWTSWSLRWFRLRARSLCTFFFHKLPLKFFFFLVGRVVFLVLPWRSGPCAGFDWESEGCARSFSTSVLWSSSSSLACSNSLSSWRASRLRLAYDKMRKRNDVNWKDDELIEGGTPLKIPDDEVETFLRLKLFFFYSNSASNTRGNNSAPDEAVKNGECKSYDWLL